MSAMVSDYRQTAIQLDEQLPYANITSPEWSEQARAWLTANAPHASVWDMPSHLGFWEKPTEFNARLTEFLRTGH